MYVHDGGRLLVDRSRFTANGDPGEGSGRGAVGSSQGIVSIVDSSFDHNKGLYGGGVYNDRGHMWITRTTFSDNDCPSVIGNGGAVFNDQNSDLVMSRSTATGNHAGIFGGNLYNSGSMRVHSSTVTDGDVGYAGSPFNVPGEGGGIANFGTMTVTDTRIVANHSSLDIGTDQGTAAGVKNFHDAVITLVHSPVVRNVAVAAPGGISNDNGTVRLRHSRVAHNTPTNCTGTITPVPGCHG